MIETVPIGIPTPCLRCGAPMTPTAPSGLHVDPSLVCAFCGSTEAMPGDAAAQHRYLRLRMAQIRRAREGAEAPLATYATVKQTWLMALVPLVAIGGWQWWQLLTGVNVAAGPESAVFALASGAAMVGVLVGYVGMMRAFRRWVRPMLRARPPIERGLAARCRTCGAPLPAIRAPSVVCEHCGANNFLDAVMAQDTAALLAAERMEYERRARGGAAVDSKPFQMPARAFTRWMAGGAIAAFGIGIGVLHALHLGL